VIVVTASLLWAYLWLTASDSNESTLKLNFPSVDLVEELRARFLFLLTGVTDDSAGLVAGLAIGERGLISQTLSENMKELSLTHLVAVSGANLAIVAAAVFMLASVTGVPRFWRFFLAYLAIALYIVLVGPESSVLRAGAMAAFVMASWWLGRKVNPLIPLSWAVILLLLIDPALAVDFGFALSVFATLGLLILAAALHLRLQPRLGTWLSLGVSASLAAQLYTMPVLLALQPSIPLYSVLANLAVEVVVAPVTVLGILAVIATPVSPPLASLLTWFASLGTWWIEVVSNQLAQLPMTRIPMLPGDLGIFFTVLLVIGVSLVLVSKSPNLRMLGFVFAALFLVPIGWVASDLVRHSNFHQDWQVLNCDVGQGDALLLRDGGEVALIDVGQGDALLLRDGGEVALIDVGREDAPIDNCLDDLGIRHIDLLVLTHFDADHVGGIAGALEGRSVGLALLSGFDDDRPLVKLVSDVLSVSAQRVEIGYSGVTGSLGSASWRVLAPSFAANEAEDSNDASVVVLFEMTGFNVLTLGDLGERGQLRLVRNYWPVLFELRQMPLILKVAHHGSKDQSNELHELVQPDVALISVAKDNDYGHPSRNLLALVADAKARTLRTDLLGPISIRDEAGKLVAATGGKL
jgi:competence protein ComEC